MKTNQYLFYVAFIMLLSSCINRSKVVLVDPGPGGSFPASQNYSVSVEGLTSFVYQNFKRKTGENYLLANPIDSYSWTSFVSKKPVKVKVTFLGIERLDSVVVRPLSLNIKSRIVGNSVLFTMPVGRKVTVEKYNDLKHVCFLFGHRTEPVPEGITPENTITFEPGVYFPDSNMIRLKSDQAVYLKPGAVIFGRIHGENIENAQVVGRGNLMSSHIERSNLQFGEGYDEKRASRPLNISGKNLRVQGPTIVDAPFWSTRIEGTDSIRLNHVSNTAVLGWYVNSDGFQDMTHTRASDLFTCVNDDSFILNNTGDCVVERSVVWGQLAGAPLRLGWNGVKDLDTVIYRDIDVLYFRGKAGVISLKHGGPSHVKNILIDNIRIEEPIHRLVELEIKKHIWSPPNTGFGYVSNIEIKNINVYKPLLIEIKSIITGAEEHYIEDIRFENVRIAGKTVNTFDEIPLIMNEFTRNVSIKP